MVFLLGYDPPTKAEVAEALANIGATILQPIRQDHWLVRSTPQGIRSLHEQLPSTTSVSMTQAGRTTGWQCALVERAFQLCRDMNIFCYR